MRVFSMLWLADYQQQINQSEHRIPTLPAISWYIHIFFSKKILAEQLSSSYHLLADSIISLTVAKYDSQQILVKY